MQKSRIIIADAQYLIRFAVRQLVGRHGQYEVVAEVPNEAELLKAAERHQPDVVILDYLQADAFDVGTIDKLRQVAPDTQLMVISADENKDNIYRVLENGVNSFLTKTCDETEILDAVQALLKGEKFFCTQVIDFLLEKSFSREAEDCSPTPLSPREIQIVQLIAKGFTAKEISKLLSLSTHTVYTHRKNVMRKLDLSSSSELVLYAVNKGLVKSE